MPLTPLLIAGYVLAVLGVLSAIVCAAGIGRRWRERRPFSVLLRAVVTLLFLVVALAGVIGGLALHGYRRLVAETPIARIDARQLEAQRFAVRLEYPDGTRRTLELAGDQWQIDARVIKWQPSAVMAGAPPLYQLDRISGRYADPEHERERTRSLVVLREDGAFDLLALKRRFPQWMGWVDADYGSAAFLPLVDGGHYEVTLAAAGGLVARPADAVTERKLRDAGW